MYKSENINTETLDLIFNSMTFVYDLEVVPGDNVGTETVIFDSKADYLKFENKLNNPF